MTIAHIGRVNPEAGVIATNPATAPEIAPRTVGLPVLIHSMKVHAKAPAAAAKCVLMNAYPASDPAERAFPALNPNQPTHNIAAPTTDSTTLCGGIGLVRNPCRRPSTKAQTSAETPELICTTVPPAKSSTGIAPPREEFNRPPLPQTMWANGQ